LIPQYPTAHTAPFIKNEYAELANETQTVLTNVPLGLKVTGADYPVLRVFASWPGEAKLERTREWKKEQKPTTRNQTNTRILTQGSSVDNIDDPDLHPLATLHLANFIEAGKKLDEYWFRGDLEQKLVVDLKRAREEQDSGSPRLRKRAKLGTYLENESLVRD
jgi:hypothetical protein